jgi:hypothetical protein
VAVAAFAAFLAFGGLLAQPQAASASGIKVVIVVGPTGSRTSEYIGNANYIASKARSYGATVYKVYSPYATWSRVKQIARGANLFVYLGHGNGWPSPYAPFQKRTKDGLGLNSSGGNGNYNTKYYGENYIAADLDLAPNSAVLFFRLCYASGNSEPGRATPTRSTAHQRVDNYGAGFLRAGARAVFAEGWRDPSYILNGLIRTDRTMREIFWSSPRATRSYASSFGSSRTSGMTGLLDPYSSGGYYRSVVGNLDMTASQWR